MYRVNSIHFFVVFTHTYKRNMLGSKRNRILIYLLLSLILLSLCTVNNVKAMPFYNLHPATLTVRSRFYTSYSSSSAERKWNIKLASKKLNKTFVDVGGEFSFNQTVGERTARKGYKTAKIIVGGKFVDGVGGGVCQVSTTLYNAVLLAGLTITEYHAHSLPVSYVNPSFDAMVNSGSADLRFINNTSNPILIFVEADDCRITVTIVGEPKEYEYERRSVIKEELPAPAEEIIYDDMGIYPDLHEGEQKFLCYSKPGLISEGYLVVKKNGVIVGNKKIRRDRYNATKGVIIKGKTKVEENSPIES